MQHICAWCKRETAPPDGAADDDIISHGVCEDCKALVMAEVKESEIERSDYETGRFGD